MPSQQSSLSGMRTELIFQLTMARMAASSTGPSKIEVVSTHLYSEPDRLTPRNRTSCPDASTMRLSTTRNPAALLSDFSATHSGAAGGAPLYSKSSEHPPDAATT